MAKKAKNEEQHQDERIDLVKLDVYVEALREQLQALHDKAMADPNTLRFSVEEAAIELQVAFTSNQKGSTGLMFGIPQAFSFNAGGEIVEQQARTQKLTLKLKPVAPSGRNEEGDGRPTSRPDGEVLISRGGGAR